jgi:phospholipid/cholesterol/gamma-HCH transport system substrate-binding protein
VISRRTKTQLMVFFLIAAFGLSYAGARYADLGRLVPGYDKGYLVGADFSDSGGIFVGAEVTQRGVPVGKVEKLTLLKEGVRVSLRLRPGSKIPTPTRAKIGNRSAIGEQYVDLQPEVELKDDDPNQQRLGEGSVIPVSMTGIPIQPTQLVVNLDRLARSINTDDVASLLDELGDALNNSGDDLQRLIDAGDQLTTAATRNLRPTLDLIHDGGTVLGTQQDLASAIRSYNADLASLTTTLRSSEPDFRALFRSGTQAADITKDLLEANRTNLPVLLDNLVFVAQVQKVRIPALRQILTTYPNVVAGGFTVTPGDATAHFGFVTTQDPPPCPSSDPGYATTPRRDPEVVTPRESNFKAYCSLPKGQPIDVRGARNVPRAEGLQAYPYDAQGGSSTDVKGAGLAPGWTTMFGDYDPATGHAVSASGDRFVLGSTMGAAAVLGASSWQWVLMEPLRRS